MLTLIDMFIENIELKDVSANTVRSYRASLDEYKKFLQSINQEKAEDDLYKIKDESIIDDFVFKLKKEDKANSTINNRLAAIKRFYTFLYKRKVVDIDTKEILNLYEPLKQNKVESIYMTEQEAVKFLNCSKIVSSKMSKRDYTMVLIMLTLGFRVSEISNLNVADINFENSTILVRDGKGGKDRLIEMPKELKMCLIKYIKFRDTIYTKDNSLFVNFKGDRLQEGGIRKLVKQIRELSGIEKEITPHKIRHTCASLLRKGGTGIEKIKDILGHESISTTTRYTHMYDGDMREAVSTNPLLKNI